MCDRLTGFVTILATIRDKTRHDSWQNPARMHCGGLCAGPDGAPPHADEFIFSPSFVLQSIEFSGWGVGGAAEEGSSSRPSER
jgi:hypothetical protein